jgi:peptidase E
MLMPTDTMPLLVDYAMRLSGQRQPKICVINTATGDDPAGYIRFYDRLAGTDAQVRHLALFPMPNVTDPEDLLLSQDILFVGGGSVANMLAVWRVHRIDEIMSKAWQAGVVLAGSSAGGICWFEGGTTDSFGHTLRPFTDGLGMLPGSFCPHYDEGERRPLYRRLVADGTLSPGLACDAGVGAHFVDDDLVEIVADRPGRGAWRVTADASADSPADSSAEATETPLTTRFLGELAAAPGRGAVQGPAEGRERAQRHQPPGVDASGVHEQRGDRERRHHDHRDVPVVADDEVVPESAEGLELGQDAVHEVHEEMASVVSGAVPDSGVPVLGVAVLGVAVLTPAPRPRSQ